MLILHDNSEFSIDEESLINSEGDGEINILPAVATFMRRNLNRNQGYYESSLPAYSMRHELNFCARNAYSQRAPSEPQILPLVQTCTSVMVE